MTLKWPLMTLKWHWDQKPLHHCVRHGKNNNSCQPFYPLTLIILKQFMKNSYKHEKITKMTLKWPLMTIKWHWDQKPLHHCVRHGKTNNSCQPFYPLTLIILNLFMKKYKKWPKMTLRWPLITLKWHWDQKPLHHCVRQGETNNSCQPFYPLTLIILYLFMKNC